MAQLVKSQLSAITYSCLVKQLVKISKDYNEANEKLYKIGTQMGIRIADQYVNRSASYLSPFITTRQLIKGISSDYLGCQLTLDQEDIKQSKGKHNYSYKFSFKQNNLSAFVMLPKQYSDLNYHSLYCGIINGVLQSMNLYGQVTVIKDQLKGDDKTSFCIESQKQIKNQD